MDKIIRLDDEIEVSPVGAAENEWVGGWIRTLLVDDDRGNEGVPACADYHRSGCEIAHDREETELWRIELISGSVIYIFCAFTSGIWKKLWIFLQFPFYLYSSSGGKWKLIVLSIGVVNVSTISLSIFVQVSLK